VKISSQFSVAVHILCLLSIDKTNLCTSDWIAGSVNTNPVVIRKILGKLKKSKLIDVKAGSGGAFLLKDISEISLYDVYKAVEVVKSGNLFNFHDSPNPLCIVGANIHEVLGTKLYEAEKVMENSLKNSKISDLVESIKFRAK